MDLFEIFCTDEKSVMFVVRGHGDDFLACASSGIISRLKGFQIVTLDVLSTHQSHDEAIESLAVRAELRKKEKEAEKKCNRS